VIEALLLIVLAISPQESARHKEWMDRAQDLKEEVRDALEAKAPAQAAPAARKLASIGRQELRFWANADIADAHQLAQRNLDAAREIEAGAKAGDLGRTRAAFDRLDATCKACHDLHPEKRLNAKGGAR
jgi:cytochrome c556